jgi:hypothetical protein
MHHAWFYEWKISIDGECVIVVIVKLDIFLSYRGLWISQVCKGVFLDGSSSRSFYGKAKMVG